MTALVCAPVMCADRGYNISRFDEKKKKLKERGKSECGNERENCINCRTWRGIKNCPLTYSTTTARADDAHHWKWHVKKIKSNLCVFVRVNQSVAAECSANIERNMTKISREEKNMSSVIAVCSLSLSFSSRNYSTSKMKKQRLTQTNIRRTIHTKRKRMHFGIRHGYTMRPPTEFQSQRRNN